MGSTASTQADSDLEIRELKPQMTACVRLRIGPDELSGADLPEVVLAERGEVAGSELPSGRAAVLVHQGPYGRLGDSWGRMEELMAERHLLSAACGWEHYIDDPETVPPEELRTELVHPIA